MTFPTSLLTAGKTGALIYKDGDERSPIPDARGSEKRLPERPSAD